MKKISQGFIFLMVLFLLQLCSWLGIYSTHQISKMVKLSGNVWKRQSSVYTAYNLLSLIETRISESNINCIIPIMPPDLATKKNVLWWQSNGCSGNFSKIMYYYIVEQIGTDPCRLLEASNHVIQPVTINFYRITLFAFPEGMEDIKIFLQSTVALLSDELKLCQDSYHLIKLGRQMQREI